MAAGYDDPAVQRRRLRVELRKARLEAKKTQRDVAEAMDWSVSKLIRIENGEVRISRNDLRALVELYGIMDKRRVEALLEMARVAREDPWAAFRDVHSQAFLTYLGFESSTYILRNYEPFLVAGLLQTEEYNWAIQTEVFGEDPQTAERRWDARRQRQKLHERDKPPEMFFILDETVIRRRVGGTGVMRRQLEQLKAWSVEPHVTLQVLPYSFGAYAGMGYPFTLLEFQNPNDDNVLYLEHATELTTQEDPEETGNYLTRFFDLESKALSPAETQLLLDEVISELDAESAGVPEHANKPQEAKH